MNLEKLDSLNDETIVSFYLNNLPNEFGSPNKLSSF